MTETRTVRQALFSITFGIVLVVSQQNLSVASSIVDAILPSCGTLTFDGTPSSDPMQMGFDVDLTFDFTPHFYCNSCFCESIAFVQVVRITNSSSDPADDPFPALRPHYRKRMVQGQSDPDLNGWAVDRGRRNAKFGYYGMLDSGKFSGSIRPGQNLTTPATPAGMVDSPDIASALALYPGPLNFEAITVPVCIDSQSNSAQTMCGACLLHYELWAYMAEKNGVEAHAKNLSHQAAGDWLSHAVDLAIKAWNVQGGHDKFPGSLYRFSSR